MKVERLNTRPKARGSAFVFFSDLPPIPRYFFRFFSAFAFCRGLTTFFLFQQAKNLKIDPDDQTKWYILPNKCFLEFDVSELHPVRYDDLDEFYRARKRFTLSHPPFEIHQLGESERALQPFLGRTYKFVFDTGGFRDDIRKQIYFASLLYDAFDLFVLPTNVSLPELPYTKLDSDVHLKLVAYLSSIFEYFDLEKNWKQGG